MFRIGSKKKFVVNPVKFLRQDRWIFDASVAVLCASFLAGYLQILADSGEKHVELIVRQMALAAICYFVAFFFGILVKKLIKSVRSWAWMSVGGALFFSSFVFVRSAISYHDHMARFGKPMTYGEIIHDFLPSFFLSWVIFAGSGAVFIVFVRTLAYLASQLYSARKGS